MSVYLLGQVDDAATRRPIPLFAEGVSAGFPSPAQDYVERALDLNELCIRRPAATFMVRVDGDSMCEAGIFKDDILLVDRSLTAQHGDVVIACIDGEFTVKELRLTPTLTLMPRNRRYSPITLREASELDIFGVVISVVRSLNHR